MNKTAIKNYAIWARVQLIESAKQRAYEYEITENGENNPNLETIGGRLLSKVEKEQRQQLINQIRQKGYTQVMEEAAYTWFNRFIALRFMEVNGYLPSKVRVFTDENNAFKPEILKEAMSIELEGLDRGLVLELLDKQDNEALYKHLLIAQCNALNTPLPYMFERISNWTELLFPANLLRPDSVIGTMISTIPEEDWMDAVQIIGWLYQYYNSELKDETFALLKKNVKITKERIPAATQLFTPDWIVRYMVENSLGRLWYEGHRDFDKSAWKYYLDEAEQEPEVERKFQTIRAEYAQIKPEDIKVIDPCMGSGHILCYLFDVLLQIYEACGYSTREAVQSIVENNLYGLDIDDRAAQLAYFAVMMKARQYDRRFFTRGIQPHVMAIQESNTLEAFDHLQRQLSLDTLCLETANQLIRTFRDAKEYGSLLDVEIPGLDHADRLMEQLRTINGDFELMAWLEEADALLPQLARQAAIMQQKYDVVVTNPPYMGSGGMGARLSDYVKTAYPDSKSDFSTCFMEKTLDFCSERGYMAMINIPVWMFLSSYEKLRGKMIHANTFVNMVHPGRGIFGSDFGTTTFVIGKKHIPGYKGSYRRLFDKQGEVDSIEEREQAFLSGKGQFVAQQDNFSKIPGAPVAYWVSHSFYAAFTSGISIGATFRVSEGIKTGDNDRFLRLWYEVNSNSFSFARFPFGYKWYAYHKGGDYRKWYGNLAWVINWKNDGLEIRENRNSGLQGKDMYFKPNAGWSKISSKDNPVRYYPQNVLFDSMAPSICGDKNLIYIVGLLNTCVAYQYLHILNPTLALQVGDMRGMPVIYAQVDIVEDIVNSNIILSRTDWDSFETSWDFQQHPIIRHQQVLWDCTAVACTLAGIGIKPTNAMSPLEICYHLWEAECLDRFNQLKANEEELNRIFIDIYGLQDELTPEVEDKDVTVRRADLGRDIRSFISYAVGCMFGRYSLDVEGLVYAGGDFDTKYCRWIRQLGDRASEEIDENGRLVHGGWAGSSLWEYDGVRKDGKWVASSYPPDTDNIIPICDDEYFEDDIVGRFVKFVETVYGTDTLDANLKFIADALGGKGTPREVIRSYFLNDFYDDHLKIYQKRPIYWLFSSGKKNGFKCLIYMHRYQPDLLARIRTDYVHEQQERYRTQLTLLEDSQQTAGASERVKLNKQITKIKDQALELQKYEEKIHHLADQMIPIDLDDGVKVNYAKFQDVLEKIK